MVYIQAYENETAKISKHLKSLIEGGKEGGEMGHCVGREKGEILRQYRFYNHEKKMTDKNTELKKTNQFVSYSWS